MCKKSTQVGRARWQEVRILISVETVLSCAVLHMSLDSGNISYISLQPSLCGPLFCLSTSHKQYNLSISPVFSPGICTRCGEKVVGEGTGCTAMEQVYHIKCFVCIVCHLQLQGKPFYALDSKPYCEDCYLVSSVRSSKCRKNMERSPRYFKGVI